MSGKINWTELLNHAISRSKFSALPTTIKLPALPIAVTRFMEHAKRLDANLKDLAKIIETDSGLSIEVLRHVNASHLGLRHKATGVLQALTLLGLRRSKQFVISTGLQAAVQARKSKLINQTCFWNASLQKALFARHVAQMLNADGDTAFFGSLLQDYLLPILTNELYEPYLQFVDNRADQPECLTEFEQATFGWDHATAAAGLATKWHLPDELVCCILFHHQGLMPFRDERLRNTPVTAVALSALLPDQLRQHYHGLESLIELQDEWPEFDLQAVAEEVDNSHDANEFGVQNDFPLARRCQSALSDRNGVHDGSIVGAPAIA